MARYMEDLKDMLCDELDKIASKGELTAGSLDTIDKLTHSIKSIETIMAMGEYSNTDGMGDYSGARRNPPRNAMGRFVSYDGRNTNRGSNRSYDRGYSRDDHKEWMIEQLEDMMEEAKDHKVKDAIKKAIHQIEQ